MEPPRPVQASMGTALTLRHATKYHATLRCVSTYPFGSNLLFSTGLLLSDNIDLCFSFTVKDHVCYLNRKMGKNIIIYF